ncbi:type 2 isopentenyl-diphosphate Delta-isomerase [Waterburya agarophytonicola K14]|uniref:Isopentenyl-diphosphate delta-isomerase n=1 Tax=Waterburya agarophytonicola KI4 TaxID=2874699 RepID=A0A964FGC7_9CYAN|nr:type 2 isopentenyl-diphosphate Delta-isomerase [Waterburya agarophytonicola]MCC0176398.1 type 2 isopentenyl-diphosphate Delta-isomerase [Waterburya agarophytonicola KI4]
MTNTQTRKADHLRICLEDDVQFRHLTNGLDKYRFDHTCLPELNLSQVDLRTKFLAKTLNAPLLISSMTGGTEQAKTINCRLAKAAQKHGLAMGVGSQRIAVENPDVAHTFAVRSLAPDAMLFANLGAVQLNYTYGLEQCLKVVDILQADALILHLNPLQECIQPNGDTQFKGLLAKIEQLCQQIDVPVIAKEVGNGISAKMAAKLIDVGIDVIDVAGAGGTSWAKVESQRAENNLQRRLGRTFADWGISTADCIVDIRTQYPDLPLIASGGLRDGMEVAKAIALGADLAGLAFPFLQAASESETALDELIELLIAEIKTVMFCTGNQDLSQLKRSPSLIEITNNK